MCGTTTFGRLLAGALAGLSFLSAGAAASDEPALPPGRRVDVGGFRLSVHVAGGGTPSVVLLSGMGDSARVWSKVLPAVAKLTLVCAYDRAGEGESEKSPARGTLQQTVTDLHRLLLAVPVPAPHVLVGASWGGLIARVYAHQHPERVAGIVMVDATHEDTALFINHRVTKPRTAPIEEWEALVGRPSPEKGDLRADLQLVHDTRENRPFPLGDLPLVVLSRGSYDYPSVPGSPFTPEQLATAARENQADLARLSRRGKQVVVAGSGHRIHEDAAGAVIAAIREVVEAVRKGD